MNFVRASLKYPQVTITILVITFAIGLNSLLHMPRREDPKITIRQGLVIAYFPGANAVQVEDQVTKKIEQYLFQFEEVRKEKTYSTTRDGVVVVNVELAEDVMKPDIFWNKLKHELLLVKRRDLPQGVVGPIVNTEFGDTKALVIGISSENGDFAQLKNHIEKLEDELRTIQAVSKIKRIGEQEEQVVISSSSEKLSQYAIPLTQVVNVLKSQNSINATGSVKTGELEVPLYTSGYYNTEEELANQIIGTSDKGDVVRISDVADVKREYADPTSKTFINGAPAMMLAVEMHAGNNIVEFGETVQEKLAEFRHQLPTGYELTTLVDQPTIVDENISHFFHEFFLAIISVVIVVILLMPFRIAAVAATAIPMTVAATFALLHAFGIELHQVSLAALIVVLGMVVDDAIVVADNYVELLDKGEDRWTAAWRSAYDLIVPVLTATVTIIAAFLPMVILTGSVGEFIFALPITVAISLAASFIVSMILTPILCYTFIKKGLHDHEATDKKKKVTLLDRMQNAYDWTLEFAMKIPRLTMVGSVVSIVLAVGLYVTLKQKFFPAAERNQFVIELWMPTGTQLDETEKAIFDLQKMISDDERVVDYSAFVGFSAPRFYYNFSPEFPVTNYGQILVNTTSAETATNLATALNEQMSALFPEARVEAKLMQQGSPTKAPVEVRIVGNDLLKLKELGEEVKQIMSKTQGSRLVRTDFMQDIYGVDIQLSGEASRLGFTTGSVAQTIYTGFHGAPITTMYEGDDPLDIVLRLEDQDRNSFDDLKNTYLPSPATGAPVPLRQIANLEPQWHIGRIMHRNGLRTLTVGSETTADVLPSQLLKRIKPQLDQIDLPHGYHFEFGGEHENKIQTFSQMVVALGISLVLIFLILLLQFKNLKESTIVMYSIPLSLFGALAGLHLTGNNFGFTAFVGLISLSGIVVRNAIILVDYTNELMAEKGMSIKDAAIEAGKRRLRPIFLTAAAAAIGVIPMIVSGSPMWSPLASVIAIGVLFSMFMSLIVVPVFYVKWMKPKDKPDIFGKAGTVAKMLAPVLMMASFSLFSHSANAQTERTYNLQMVTDSALANNHLLTIKELQIQEQEAKVQEAKLNYFPSVNVGAGYAYLPNLPELTVPQGALGVIPATDGNIYLPGANLNIELGEHHVYNVGVLAYQPISQLPRIKLGVLVAQTEMEIKDLEKQMAVWQIKKGVEQLYYAVLIAAKQKEEAEARWQLVTEELQDAENAVASGKTILVNIAGLKAKAAAQWQAILELENSLQSYQDQLAQLAGLAVDSLKLQESEGLTIVQLATLDYYETLAMQQNHEINVAELTFSKAESGVKASQRKYIPDLGLVGGYVHQSAGDFNNIPFAGVMLQWNVKEVFSNKDMVTQRKLNYAMAEENLKNMQETKLDAVQQTYRQVNQSAKLIAVAEEVVTYRTEALQLEQNRVEAGLSTVTKLMDAKAALAKAKADYLGAQLKYRLSLTDLKILIGTEAI